MIYTVEDVEEYITYYVSTNIKDAITFLDKYNMPYRLMVWEDPSAHPIELCFVWGNKRDEGNLLSFYMGVN